MNAASKHTVITALSLLAGIMLVYWIQPAQSGGTIFLVAICVILFNAAAAIFWRTAKVRPKPRKKSAKAAVRAIGFLAVLAIPAAYADCVEQCVVCSAFDRSGRCIQQRTDRACEERNQRCLLEALKPKPDSRSETRGLRFSDRPAPAAPSAAAAPRYYGTPVPAAPSSAARAKSEDVGAATGGGFPPAPPPIAPIPAAPTAAAPLRPVRGFLRAKDIPPPHVGAYGVVAFKSLPTSASRDRLLKVCAAFLSSLPPESSLPSSVPVSDRMITIWPLTNPGAPEARRGDCDYLTQNYDLYGGVAAIEDAATPSHPLTKQGPFLIGWSPSAARGVKDAVVLVIDMSSYDSQASFDEAFQFWQRKIVEDPSLWRNGFSLEKVRMSVRDFADHYGQDILNGLKFWNGDAKSDPG